MPEVGPILATHAWLVVAGMIAADQVLVIFLWFAVAAALVLCGGYLAMAVRRWIQRDEPVVTFTIQDLRDMRARGEISDHEFAAMRASLLARIDLGDADEGAPPGPVSPPPNGGRGRPEDSSPPPAEDPPPASS